MGGVAYAVTSGKGGVGKTTTAVNLGVALHQRGHSVAILDADLGMPNVASALDVEPDATLHDVLAAGTVGGDDVARSVVELAEGFGILAGDTTLEGYAAAEPTGLAAVVDALVERYDCVLVDTGGGLNYEGALPLECCDEALLVTSTNPAAVGDTAKSKELADRLGTQVAGVVVTRVTDGDDAAELAGRLGVDLLGTIPFDPAVTESATAGAPLAAHAPDGEAAAAYDRLAESLSGSLEGSPDPSRWSATSGVPGGTVATVGLGHGGGTAALGSPGTAADAGGTGAVDAADREESTVADGDGEPTQAGGVLARISGLLR